MKKSLTSLALVVIVSAFSLLLFSDIFTDKLVINNMSPGNEDLVSSAFNLSYNLLYDDDDVATKDITIKKINLIIYDVEDAILKSDYVVNISNITIDDKTTDGSVIISYNINLDTIFEGKLSQSIQTGDKFKIEQEIVYSLPGSDEEKTESPKNGIYNYSLK